MLHLSPVAAACRRESLDIAAGVYAMRLVNLGNGAVLARSYQAVRADRVYEDSSLPPVAIGGDAAVLVRDVTRPDVVVVVLVRPGYRDVVAYAHPADLDLLAVSSGISWGRRDGPGSPRSKCHSG